MRILLAWLVAFCSDAIAADTNGFDACVRGMPPAGWTASITGEGTPQWEVVADPDAPSQPQALRQAGVVPKSSFPLCLQESPKLKDGFVEVRFKTTSGEIDQAAGLVWRALDENNYYVCRANALEHNVVLYKVLAGKRTALDIVGRKEGYGVETRVEPATWHTLRVDFSGTRFQVSFDGRSLFSVEDATFTSAGRVGFWTKADSVTLFDDFRAMGSHLNI